ncbi:MAG: hypothetical protein IJG30_05550, partial [Synergistaceae bacterium]|nr:hypothetical protein [Synergistaceae bacterium]
KRCDKLKTKSSERNNGMLLELDEKTNTRIQSWSAANNQPPEVFINYALEQSLDDWEDYADALSICAEIDAGRMKTYSLEEVERQLDEPLTCTLSEIY